MIRQRKLSKDDNGEKATLIMAERQQGWDGGSDKSPKTITSEENDDHDHDNDNDKASDEISDGKYEQFYHDNSRTKTSFSQNISFRVAQWAILRLLALIYAVAFLAAWNQNLGLMGKYGLEPAAEYWQRLQQNHYQDAQATSWNGFLHAPSIFWWLPLTDFTLNGVAIVGLILSLLLLTGMYVSWLSLFVLWLLQFTLITSSQHTAFYQYGWESQLLETGFLAIFLLPHLPRLEWHSSRHSRYYKWMPLRVHWALTSQTQCQTQTQQQPSILILWLFRWLCFRISLGAGLIKVRGSSCWTDKTCLWYHFETQPIPSPLSFVFHFLPHSILSKAVDLDLFVQLYTSWMVLLIGKSNLVRQIVRGAGLVQAGFMINIMISGNFSMLNHMTIIPALACLDDAVWPEWVQAWIVPHSNYSNDDTDNDNSYSNYEDHTDSNYYECDNNDDDDDDVNEIRGDFTRANPQSVPLLATSRTRTVARTTAMRTQRQPPNTTAILEFPPRRLVNLAFFILIGVLSWPVILNLVGSGRRQVMNASFDRFHLVNTYGAFGSVGKTRMEPILSVSANGLTYKELEFPCKPGSVTRRPCFCAPYHYRVDWNIWFLGFPPHRTMLANREKWLYALLERLLNPSTTTTTSNTTSTTSGTTRILDDAKNPWLDVFDDSSAAFLRHHGASLKLAKVDMYRYQMAAPLWDILYDYWQQWAITLGWAPKTAKSMKAITWWNRTYQESLIAPVGFKPNLGLVWEHELD